MEIIDKITYSQVIDIYKDLKKSTMFTLAETIAVESALDLLDDIIGLNSKSFTGYVGEKAFFIVEKNTILGFLIIDYNNHNNLYLNSFYIFPKFRKKGYGSLLLKELVNSIEDTTLYIDAVDYNLRELYEKFGFEPIPPYELSLVLNS